MIGPKRSLLLPLSSVIKLAEASAFKITKEYVFTWKQNKTGTGLKPVHIKHVNVPKHYKDLVDPDKGSPLQNTIIGTIPAFYKQASNLLPKDPSKTVADLMKAGDEEESKSAAAPSKKPTKADNFKQQADALAPKLGFKPGSPQAAALAALMQHGNNADATEALAGTSEDEEALEKAMEQVEKVTDNLQKSNLYANIKEDENDEGVLHVDFLPAAFSFAVGAIASPKPVFSPVPAPKKNVTPAPAPAPTTTPTLVSASNPLGYPSIPPIETLTLLGSAKGSLGGYHDKFFFKDGAGNKFLFKPAEASAANAGAVYAAAAAKVLDHTVPVVTATLETSPGEPKSGSVQPMLPNVKTDLSKVAVTDLSKPQLETLMKERVLDWALSSHDTKAANFLMTADGKVVGIDKEQAFKFIGQDSLDLTYKPNPTKQFYSDLFGQFAQKKLDLPIAAMLPAIEKIESMSDDEWTAMLDPYLKALPASQRKAKLDAILTRKKKLRKDFEGFLTGLLQQRGDLAPGDSFEFPKADTQPVSQAEPKKKKKKKDLGGSAPAAMGSILSPVPVADFKSMTQDGKGILLGATGQTFAFKDPMGQKYVAKKSTQRQPPYAEEPWRAIAQEVFSQVSAVVRPGKNLPVGIIPGGWQGVMTTLQPWLDGAKSLREKKLTPDQLTPQQQQDVAEEHALDWLLSQHDSHSGNMMVRADGHIISIDKEQGFKFFGKDSLSASYAPNTMEEEPFYNKFWGAFASGAMDFDPASMVGAIERIEAVPDEDYAKLLGKYAENSPFKSDPKKFGEFVTGALARKKNIRADFEQFISGLYKQRTKTNGQFTFGEGWGPAGGAAPAPEKKAKKKKTDSADILKEVVTNPLGLDVKAFSSPAVKGPIGVLNPKLVKADSVTLEENETDPVPKGYPPPAPGKMWKQSSLDSWLKSPPAFGGASVLYKEKPPKVTMPDGTLVKDENSPNVMVKLNVSAEEAKAVLDSLGIQSNPPVFSAGGHAIAIVNKAMWAAAKAADKPFAAQVDIPPKKLVLAGVSPFTTVPEKGQLSANIEAQVGLDGLNALRDSKVVGYGRGFAVDSSGLSLQALNLMRCEDAKGTFYRFNFKIRPEHRDKLVPATGSTLEYKTREASYDPAKDAWVQGSGQHSAFGFSANQWGVGGSTVTIGADASGTPFSARNWAIADVRLNPGEDLKDGLARVLAGVSPALAEMVTSTPGEDDIETLKLSAYLWSFAPQAADKLPESKRNPSALRAAIMSSLSGGDPKKVKEIEADLAKIRLEDTGNGQVTTVLPGRSEKMRKAGVRFVTQSVAEDLNAVVDQLKGSTICMRQRLLQGVSDFATSGNGDFKTGGGDYTFANVLGDGKFFKTWGGGQVQALYDLSELDRLDCIAYPNDNWGNTQPSNQSYKDRSPLESIVGNEQETIIRTGVSSRKLLKLVCKDKDFAEKVIEKLKKDGVTSINGMLPEEVVVYGGEKASAGFAYDTYLKPAGY